MAQPLLVILVACLAGFGPWLQGTGWLPCCGHRDAQEATLATDGHACCAPSVPVVVDSCCQTPADDAPAIDAPEFDCACHHAPILAVVAAQPQVEQVADRGIALDAVAVVVAPLVAPTRTLRRPRAPPDPGSTPGAGEQFVHHRRLLI